MQEQIRYGVVPAGWYNIQFAGAVFTVYLKIVSLYYFHDAGTVSFWYFSFDIHAKVLKMPAENPCNINTINTGWRKRGLVATGYRRFFSLPYPFKKTPWRRSVSSKYLVYILFPLFSITGFLVTYYYVYDSPSREHQQVSKAGSDPEENVIFEEFEELHTPLVYKMGQKFWKNRKYVKAFQAMKTIDRREPVKSRYKLLAASYLGEAYLKGKGTAVNLKKALHYYSHPGLVRSRGGIFYRGLIYADRRFSGYNPEKARTLLEKARSMGARAAGAALAKLKTQK